MPDLSADRPPPERFTHADIQLVVNELAAGCETGCSRRSSACRSHWGDAQVVLIALAVAGRLLAPGAEHDDDLRPRWQVQYFDTAFPERHAAFYDDRAEADETLTMVRASPRYSEIKLLRKIATPWVEVVGSQPDA